MGASSNRERWGRRGEQSWWGQRSTYNRGRELGLLHQGPLRLNTWSSPFANAKSYRRPKELRWAHGLYNEGMKPAGLSGIETGTKLYISNLDYGVSNGDIKELFSEFGQLKRYSIHYDRKGRSIGSAEVVYTWRSDALAALKRYNNVQLDGKPMRVEVIGGNAGTNISACVSVNGGHGRERRTVIITPGVRQAVGSTSFSRLPRSKRGSKRGTRGQGQGRGRGGKKPVGKIGDELDKDLENYHVESMNI